MSPRTAAQNEQIREQRRLAILFAAQEVFALRGYSATTIEQIAKAAGTSKGLVYNYFESKEALLKAIFDQIMKDTDDLWQMPEQLPAKNKLRFMIDGTFHYLKSNTKVIRLLIQLAMQPDIISELKQVIDAAQLGKFFVMEPIFKELGYEKPLLETYYLGALLDGVSFGYMIMGNKYPLDEIKNRIYIKYNLQ